MGTALQSPVRISLPARPEYVAVARGVLLAAGGRAGLTLDDGDDMALAVDEMCAALLDAGAESDLSIVVLADGGSLRVETSAQVAGAWPPPGWGDSTAAMILEALVDEVSFGRKGEMAVVKAARPR